MTQQFQPDGRLIERVYLGDSVYVEVENGMLKLTTDNGLGPSNTIYLEPDVAAALLMYMRRVGWLTDSESTR
jgi:hypothetical protein